MKKILVVGLMAISGAIGAAETPLDLNSLDQRLKITERQLELQAEEAEAKKKTAINDSFDEKGFTFYNADKSWGLKLSGLVQADNRTFFEDQVKPQANNNTVRRARFQVDAAIGPKAKLRLQQDIATGLIVDAYGELKLLPWATLRAGLFKTPFSLENLRTDPARDFVEKGFTTDMVTDRDTGAWLELADPDQVAFFGVGVFNGSVDSTAVVTGDTDDDKDVVAKVFLQPFRAFGVLSLRDLGFGVAASGGNRAAGTSFLGANQFRPIGQGAGFYSAASNTTTVEDASLRVVPQAYFFWQSLSFLGEYARSTQAYKSAANTNFDKKALVANEAYQVQLGWVLTGEDAAFSGLKLNKDSSSEWGALQLVGRYQGLNFDQESYSRYDASGTIPTSARFIDPRTSPSSASAWGVGLNYVPVNNVKLLVDWEQTAYVDGAKADTGTATRTVNRETEKVLLTRLQFTF